MSLWNVVTRSSAAATDQADAKPTRQKTVTDATLREHRMGHLGL
jgi:hypothetical protein